jgi:hypothetical protein
MALLAYLCREDMTRGRELTMVLFLSLCGMLYLYATLLVWVPHVAFSLSMQEALIGDRMQWLLLPCHLVGMLSMFVSELFSALFNSLLLMFLVAYIAYILAVYIRYLHTAAPAPRYERMHHAV